MNNLYNKIYEAVNNGIQKALIIKDDQSEDSSVIFHHKEINTEFIPYEYRTVDLGLPSGLLWCEYNLGAAPNNIAESWCGNYYAWGETETKDDYSWNNYKFGESKYLTKYNANFKMGDVDRLKQLVPGDDVVTMQLGENYRMPTIDECRELLEHTNFKYVSNYKGIENLNGRMLISVKNGNTIFFPFCGIFREDMLKNSDTVCSIWSSSLNLNDMCDAHALYLERWQICTTYYCRYNGISVRGVKNKI